jgi:7,8-dihydropterin-6-yl-methyl-4-(beta-D-ribofuranosyl)aminobenzene 5'-phosphate synthase
VETVPLLEAESLEITTLVDNTIDGLLPPQEGVRRNPWVSTANPMLDGGMGRATLTAEHGFSALVRLTVRGEVHNLLFDAGVSPNGLIDNIDRLQIEPKDFEAIVLSHGHFDHTGGLDGLARRLGRSGLPLLAHRHAYVQRRNAPPNGTPVPMPPPSRSALEGAGFEVLDSDDPSLLFRDALLLTGEVPRGSFEPGMPPSHQHLTESGWEHDPLVQEDQAMVVNVAGRGLVVLTGCGHAGIVNIVTRAKQITGVEAVHAVLGGFHLGGPFYEPYIDATAEALKAFQPDIIVPAHCTGWRAQQALATKMPAAFIQNAVGTSFLFGASAN